MVKIHSAPCRRCGHRGLVMESGAAHPFLWCEWCGQATKAPARKDWRPGGPGDAVEQLEQLEFWADAR